MVQLPNLGKVVVKSEREDCYDPDFGFNSKKPKIQHSSLQQGSKDRRISAAVEPQELQHSLETEPSPLGLRLKKSPSFLDFVQTKLAQSAPKGAGEKRSPKDGTRSSKTGSGSASSEKLKASNFPASLLRIGNWERVSRYEGDLVGKFYFAKHKLVWEVLDGGLKSKIEVQWSDIAAIKASFSEDGPDTLDIVLSRQPLFFRETNPQPRKHTLWQATADFTGGQATLYRRHYVECQQGFMSRHLEKLVRCDPRLYALSQRPMISLDNPFFEHKPSIFEDGDRFNAATSFKSFGDSYQLPEPLSLLPPSLDSSASGSRTEMRESDSRVPNVDAHDHRTATECQATATDGNASSSTQIQYNIQALSSHFKVPGLRPSMSRSEMMNLIGNHIHRQLNRSSQSQPNTAGNEDGMIRVQFEELAQHLLTDSQNPSTAATDEAYLMSRVNSLCSLIQKDEHENRDVMKNNAADSKADLKPNDSFGDLLLSLPRIASYPHFL